MYNEVQLAQMVITEAVYGLLVGRWQNYNWKSTSDSFLIIPWPTSHPNVRNKLELKQLLRTVLSLTSSSLRGHLAMNPSFQFSDTKELFRLESKCWGLCNVWDYVTDAFNLHALNNMSFAVYMLTLLDMITC